MVTDATLTGKEVLQRFVVIKHTCGILYIKVVIMQACSLLITAELIPNDSLILWPKGGSLKLYLNLDNLATWTF